MFLVINNSETGHNEARATWGFHTDQGRSRCEKETLKGKPALLHAGRRSKRWTPEAVPFLPISDPNMISWVYSLEIKPFQGKALHIASKALSETIRKLWVSFPWNSETIKVNYGHHGTEELGLQQEENCVRSPPQWVCESQSLQPGSELMPVKNRLRTSQSSGYCLEIQWSFWQSRTL